MAGSLPALPKQEGLMEPECEYMFNFQYEKPSDEIIAKAKIKRSELVEKIEERKTRIKETRGRFGIDDAVMIDLLHQARDDSQRGRSAKMSYTSNARSEGSPPRAEVTVPAGVVSNLMTEHDCITSEAASVASLELVIRNLQDMPDERHGMEGKLRGHRLSKDELIYLGF